MFKTAFKRFGREEAGALSVETVVIFPILLWALGATFVFWDAYKTRNINLKATYTIADMISREVDAITPEYIDGMNNVFEFLTNGESEHALRVTVVKMGLADDGTTPQYKLAWSHSTDAEMPPLDDIQTIVPKLPQLAIGDQLIVVESKLYWEPVFRIGLDARHLNQFVFSSPRFVPQVKFDDGSATAAAPAAT